jgi:3-hydroxyisobutyrate dehydrogenase-like beta-hydroxyacid dehydrogenase
MLYVSGAKADEVLPLSHDALKVARIGPETGQASAFKMLYAGIRKGTNALYLAMMLAAEHYGLYEALDQELKTSQGALHQSMQKLIPKMPPDSVRWAAEMEEIMATLATAGVTRNFHQGAHDLFTLLSKTPFAAENKEKVDPNRTPRQTVQGVLAAARKQAD